MNREYYVFKLGKAEDTSVPRFGFGPQGPQRAAQPRRDGRRFEAADALRLNVVDDPEQPAPQPPNDGDGGYGYTILRTSRADMNVAFTTPEAAERYANEQAQLNPKTLFGVFTCIKVFETTTPSVIEKVYNDAGELVLKQS